MKRPVAAQILFMATAMLVAGVASGQRYPDKPVRMVTGGTGVPAIRYRACLRRD